MSNLPPKPQSKSDRPRNLYETIGLVRGLSSPQMAKASQHIKMQILLNILLAYINSPEVNMEVWRAGLEFVSDNIKATIGK